MKLKPTLALLTLSILSITTANALPSNAESHIIVAPNCLVTAKSANIKTLATTNSMSLLAVNDQGIDELIVAKTKQKNHCGGFMDVSYDWQNYHGNAAWRKADLAKHFLNQQLSSKSKAYAATSHPVESRFRIQYETEVNSALQKLNPQNMWTSLTTLTDFKDRYARSDNGVKAAEWLKSEVERMASDNGRTDIKAYFVKTGGYKQPSLVVKFGDQEGAGIVIGAHMDTLSSSFSRKPGADDDGSGTVTVLEVARTLLSSGMHFKKPIYFIWYAAEEEGLVGSGYVVRDFKEKQIPVDAVIHFDMTGFAYQNDPTIWLLNDYTNSDLTKYLATLINTYVKQPVDYTKCGYACSDHASWTKGGYASAIPFEAKFGTENSHIHSSKDTMDWLSLDHMTSYAKIGVAFAVELAEPA